MQKLSVIIPAHNEENYIGHCLSSVQRSSARLKRFGAARGLRYGTIRRAPIVTSCRKFDLFGDWYLFKNPRMVKSIFSARNQPAANHFYYNVKR